MGKRTTGVVLGFAALLAGVAFAEISPRALTVNSSAVTDVERKSFEDGTTKTLAAGRYTFYRAELRSRLLSS